jgi:hypothetical protein
MSVAEIFSLDRHVEDLVAVHTPRFVVGLKGDHLAVEAPVSLRIVGTKRKLADVPEMFFFRVAERILRLYVDDDQRRCKEGQSDFHVSDYFHAKAQRLRKERKSHNVKGKNYTKVIERACFACIPLRLCVKVIRQL